MTTGVQPQIEASQAVVEPLIVPSEPAATAALRSRITVPPGVALAVALIWMLVAAGRSIVLLLDVRALAAVRRDARLWSTEYDFPVYLSDCVQVPLAAGFVHPSIILPASLVHRLPAEAVEAIVIHEVAHLRRYDVWTNALARVAEAFIVLTPAAWFVMRRLSMEREIACDDWVVARTGGGETFARALASLASGSACRMPLAAPSVLGSRHAIVVRIEELLDSRPRRLRLSPPALGGALVLLALIALAVQSVSPVLAYAPPQAPPRARGSAAMNVAANCPVPDRGVRLVRLMTRFSPNVTVASDKLESPLDARTFIDHYGAARVATFDLTVDAAGVPRKVVVLSAPRIRAWWNT